MADYLERRWVELVMVSVTYSCQAATRCPACRYVTDECVTELLRLIGQVEAVQDCPAQLSLRLGPPLARLALLPPRLAPPGSPTTPHLSDPHALTPRDLLPLHPRLRCILHLLHFGLTTLLSISFSPTAYQRPGGPWRVTALLPTTRPRLGHAQSARGPHLTDYR